MDHENRDRGGSIHYLQSKDSRDENVHFVTHGCGTHEYVILQNASFRNDFGKLLI